MPERDAVHLASTGTRRAGHLAARLQRGQAARGVARSDAGLNHAAAVLACVNRDRTSYRWSRRKIRWGGNPACQAISVTQRTDMSQICGSASDLIKPRAM